MTMILSDMASIKTYTLCWWNQLSTNLDFSIFLQSECSHLTSTKNLLRIKDWTLRTFWIWMVTEKQEAVGRYLIEMWSCSVVISQDIVRVWILQMVSIPVKYCWSSIWLHPWVKILVTYFVHLINKPYMYYDNNHIRLVTIQNKNHTDYKQI